jgi:hypothetical protein
MSRTAKIILLISLGINALALAAFVVMEKTVQISERVLARLDLERPVLREHRYTNLDYVPLSVQAISVHGIADFRQESPVFDRLGHEDLEFRAELEKLGRHTAGVRVRFKTDSARLHLPFLRLKPISFSYPYLSEQAAAGIDIYVDKSYVITLTEHDVKGVISVSDSTRPKKLHLIELYLPSFSPAELREIGIEPGSRVEAAPAYGSSLVFYGTSITQGAAAPRPGLTFPAIISRGLGADFYNYGFSGNGQGDPEVAQLLAGVNADIFVLEYSRQAPGTEADISKNLLEFCGILKARQPGAAIVIVTALYDAGEARGDMGLEARRRAFRVAFERLRKQYSDVHLVEGYELLGPDDLDQLTDGTHPNALGMTTVSERLLPKLQSILEAGQTR